MAKTERVYNIPLRKAFYKAPRYRKAKKAVSELKEFLLRHMKCTEDQLKIGRRLNLKIWEDGVKNPPHHVKVTVIKQDDGIVKAELFGYTYEEPVKQQERKQKGESPEKAVEAAATEQKADEETAASEKKKPKAKEPEAEGSQEKQDKKQEQPKKKAPAKKASPKKKEPKETKKE